MSASTALICTSINKLGLTLKKSVRAAGQDRPDIAAARSEWREKQPDLDPGKLIFIDENLASHQVTDVRRSIEAAHAVPFY